MKEIVITQENFAAEVLHSDKPVLLDFWASWCGPCKMLAPVLSAFAETHPEIKVGKVNVDEQDMLAMTHSVSSIPTLILYRDGKAVKQTVGYQSAEALAAFVR